MRYVIAFVLAGMTVAAVVVLGSLQLNPHGHQFINMGGLNGVNAGQVTWTAARASWQTPVAVVVAVLGIGAAAIMAYRRGSDRPVAPN